MTEWDRYVEWLVKHGTPKQIWGFWLFCALVTCVGFYLVNEFVGPVKSDGHGGVEIDSEQLQYEQALKDAKKERERMEREFPDLKEQSQQIEESQKRMQEQVSQSAEELWELKRQHPLFNPNAKSLDDFQPVDDASRKGAMPSLEEWQKYQEELRKK